jgi:hypothetical protein
MKFIKLIYVLFLYIKSSYLRDHFMGPCKMITAGKEITKLPHRLYFKILLQARFAQSGGPMAHSDIFDVIVVGGGGGSNLSRESETIAGYGEMSVFSPRGC